MYELISFHNWIVDEDTPFGSGASIKSWLVNIETMEKGIFKFPKIKDDNTITGEYWAEKLASEIAAVIGLESARVDIGIYSDKKGSMSYMLLANNEELIEGIHYITKLYPTYNGDKFEDSVVGANYSIQMIMSSLSAAEELRRQFLKIPIFDCLIGNSDRHHNNWATIKNKKTGEVRISPVYDNGSSLCCYVNPAHISDFLGDKLRFDSLLHGKSRSLIGWNGQKRPRHFELFERIIETYYEESCDFLEEMERNLTDEAISLLVHNFNDETICASLKKLVIKFLIERRNIMITIYLQRKETNCE